MKKIIKLTERDLTKIVKKVISENEVDEGLKSTLKGVGGWFKGRGYRYTKYAYETAQELMDLNEQIKYSKRELTKILRTVEYSMEGDQKQSILLNYLNDSLDSYDNIIRNNDLAIKELNESIGDTSHITTTVY